MNNINNSLNDLGKITIDLGSLKRNYLKIKELVGNKIDVAAVLKANAYGLGIKKISISLQSMGCKIFFVANLKEGIELRKYIKSKNILVLNGLPKFTKKNYLLFIKYNLIPVFNSYSDLKLWKDFTSKKNYKGFITLHFDTGMNRLGIPLKYLNQIKNFLKKNKYLKVFCIMSHLASADEQHSVTNKKQKELFNKVIKCFPKCRSSLANTSAIFNLKDFTYSFVRSGGALFGINPNKLDKRLESVVSLKAKVIQIRDLRNEPMKIIGYNSTYRIKSSIKIAVLGIGYADGYPRNLSNVGFGIFKEKRLPIVGNISMDYMTIDISIFEKDEIKIGDWVDLIGNGISIQRVAKLAETIEYEILNNLGHRIKKNYIETNND